MKNTFLFSSIRAIIKREMKTDPAECFLIIDKKKSVMTITTRDREGRTKVKTVSFDSNVYASLIAERFPDFKLSLVFRIDFENKKMTAKAEEAEGNFVNLEIK